MNRPNPIPFDTHRFVKRLTNEGMPPGQAEALAEEQISLLNSNLATKQDVANCATRQDLANCATRQDIANCATKQDLANCATKQDVAEIWARVEAANFATRDDLGNFPTRDDLQNFATKQEFAILKSEIRTLKWVVAVVGVAMLTVNLGMASLMIKLFLTV